VKCIRVGHTNVYLLPLAGGAVLVDVGGRRTVRSLLSRIEAEGLAPQKVRLIVVTHTHYDHVGGLADVVEATGAKVLVHEREAGFLRDGYTPLPRAGSRVLDLLTAAANRRARFIGRYHPVAPDITAGDRCDLGEWGIDAEVLHTPGHTAGSLSVVHADGRAFVGDAMFNNLMGRVYPPFVDDPAALAASWDRLAETGCGEYFPAHGAPISRDAFLARRDELRGGSR